MRSLPWTLFLRTACLVLLPAVVAPAEPPDVKFLFPSGVQQGQTRKLQVQGKPGTAPLRGWTSDDAITLTPSENGKEVTLTAAAQTAPGVYWARIFNGEGASELLPIVVGVLPEIAEPDGHNDSAAADVSLPTVISGVLSKTGEVDSFSVQLQAGQTLIASVDAHRVLGSAADMVLQLVSGRGFVIDQNDDHHGLDPQIVHTATETGLSQVRVFAFPASPDSSIRFAGGDAYVYRLTLTSGPFIDQLLPLAVTAEMTGGFRAVGWNLPEQAGEELRICDPSSITVHTPFPGSFLMNRLGRVAGEVAVEGETPSGDRSTRLAFPGGACGSISAPGESDRFVFQASKGQKLFLSVAARAFDSPLDPVLRVLDPGGKMLKEFDDLSRDNADVRGALTLPTDGEYRAEVTDRFGHGGADYVYHLQLQADEPRYALSLKQTRYAVAAGKSVEIPVAIERTSGFDAAIRVSISGLPEGVRAATAESSPTGKSATSVALKLEADSASAFNGPVSVVGRSDGGDEVRASTPTAIDGLTIDHFWLTVRAATE